MGKKTNGSLIDYYLDFAKDAKDFATRLEEKYSEGLNSGESDIQAFVTAGVDSSVYILVKKVGDTLTLATKTKQELDKEFGSSLTDEMINKTASLLISLKKTTVGDNITIYGDPSNPNKITFTDENGEYQEWGKDKNGNYVQTNATDYSDIGKTAINQIGSLIIMNNQDFSNIEKIAVSTSVATIADFATYKGTAEFNATDETVSNLQGAVLSFAVSSYFAKNDNISDILGMDGTFIGELAENLLLNTLFCPTSSLQRENLYSLSLLSSHKILSSSLELEKNKILNNRFYEKKKIA